MARSHLSSPQIAPRWSGERGEGGHNGRWTPSKRMFCERWERRWGWREGSGVSGDRFASGDSPIHLSLTLTPGAPERAVSLWSRQERPRCHTSPQPPKHILSLRRAHTRSKHRSKQRGNLMLGSLPRLAAVARVLVSLGQS